MPSKRLAVFVASFSVILGSLALVRQELQGDKAVQLYVLGLVHHTHSAAA